MPPLDFEEICDSARCPTPEALEAARRMVSDDPSADTRLLRALNIALLANDPDLPALERLLELLSEVSPPERLYPALRAALGHSDARVRSKAALVLGRKGRTRWSWSNSPEMMMRAYAPTQFRRFGVETIRVFMPSSELPLATSIIVWRRTLPTACF
jgi:hypothetical protein